MKLQLAIVLVVSGCSSVTMMDGSDGPISDKACDVRVYQTQAQALKQGSIEELCIITGDTSLRFSHHSSEAIAKHKDKACACGASNAYVQSRMDGDIGMQGQVTMVAFRYVNSSPQKPTPVAVVQRVQPIAPVAARTTDAVVTTNAETAKVVQFLSDTGFPLVGEPVRFKQKDSLTFYEARGTGGRITQVVCKGGACRLRKIDD
ncbi:MAG: hypothetical protein J0M13_07695 [Candidatus Accumulibacter sp.]|jgi:hypothetical protein|nr:hypothetical protein [Candidatus Accumulibacter necessarius]